MNSEPNSFQDFLCDFAKTVDQAAAHLRQLADAEKQKNGGWTKKEILGHLIDSAANNHQRFVRAQFMDDLCFPGYQQDDWVAIQKYASESWENLEQLWTSYNRHLLHLMESIPAEVLTKPRVDHNLDQIAFKLVPSTEPTTLEYFVRDYVDHMRHHLDQILAK